MNLTLPVAKARPGATEAAMQTIGYSLDAKGPGDAPDVTVFCRGNVGVLKIRSEEAAKWLGHALQARVDAGVEDFEARPADGIIITSTSTASLLGAAAATRGMLVITTRIG